MTTIAVKDAIDRFKESDSAVLKIYTIGSSQPYQVSSKTLKLATVWRDGTIVFEDKDREGMTLYIDSAKIDAIHVIPYYVCNLV